jgi:hypothetical protein
MKIEICNNTGRTLIAMMGIVAFVVNIGQVAGCTMHRYDRNAETRIISTGGGDIGQDYSVDIENRMKETRDVIQ